MTGLVIAVMAVLVAAPAAFAVPATQTWVGQPAGPTPDLERAGLTIFDAAGNPTPVGNTAGTINIAIDGTHEVAFCIDTNRSFSTSPQPVNVTTFAPPATADDRAVVWIMLNRTPTGPPTAEKNTQAAVAQAAVWILRGQASATAPTSDAGINAAAVALVSEARAATLAPASVGVTASTPAAGATTSTLTVTGRPGATVTLAVTSGSGSLGATSLTIGASGSATTSLTVTGPGTVGISATTAGDGTLVTVVPDNLALQATAYAQQTQIDTTVSVSFGSAPSVTPVVPVTPAQVVTPRLRIVKAAPARSRVLTNVNYRITVRNPGTVPATNVVLKDRLPRGLSFVRSSVKGKLRNGVVTFQLGTIAPGKSKSVTVVLMANASVKGSRTNVATVSATKVRQLEASAATIFRRLARRTQPAVTG